MIHDNYVLNVKIANSVPGKARTAAKAELAKALQEFMKALPEGVYVEDFTVSEVVA